MLLWGALILTILWVLGVIANIGGGIHLFLVIAVIMFIVYLVGRRRPV
ncbi:DUF5670 family protein [Sinomonas sp. ASV322]|nr:DUF5670 family protein [Sinomonas sp. ASV322]MDQ4501469.1 DUF5670 family protein [Sinomonas sp. ASV322]